MADDDKKPTETAEYLDKWYEQKVAYNTRDALIYAVGIGLNKLNWTYENHSDFAVFPTFPITLLFKGTEFDVVSFPSPAMTEGPPLPPLQGMRVGLDGERYIEMIEPLETTGLNELVLKSRLIGCHARGTGATVETEALLTDPKTGKLKYRIISGAFLVGAKNFKDSGRSNSESVPIPKRAPDAVVDVPTSPFQPQIYRLSGDYNPLHVDPEMATMSGFQEPILHGLNSLGISAGAVLRTFGEDKSENFKSIKCRFASPVLPGQTLSIEMWKEPNNKIVFQTKVKETGKVSLSNAYVVLNSTKSKL